MPQTPAKILMAPNGAQIRGTLERLTSVATIASATEASADGPRFEIQYAGDTEIFWDDQRTVIRDGQRVFLDDFGGEWLESQLQLIDDPDATAEDPASTDAAPIGQATDPNMFRHLDAAEAEQFRDWARTNYAKHSPINATWHPIIRAECEAINAAH